MRTIGSALGACLLALVLAGPARADDATLWSTYSGGDAGFIRAGTAAVRACHTVERTNWRDFDALIAAERHRGGVIHNWAARVRAEAPSGPVGVDGRSLALNGLSAYGRMSRAFVAAFRHGDAGEVASAKRYRAQGGRWARRAFELAARAHQVFRRAGYKDPPLPSRPRMRPCMLRFRAG
jgi:hypothetical protein